LDTLCWNDPDGAGLYYERVPVWHLAIVGEVNTVPLTRD
jgi:hypothetical protein